MAGLLLHHRSCPEAGLLWSVLKNTAGQTPADIAFRCVNTICLIRVPDELKADIHIRDNIARVTAVWPSLSFVLDNV